MTADSFERISATFATLLAPMIIRLPVATYENVTFTLASAMCRKIFAATAGRSATSTIRCQHVQGAADFCIAVDVNPRRGNRVKRLGERTRAIRAQVDGEILHQRVHVDLLLGRHARVAVTAICRAAPVRRIPLLRTLMFPPSIVPFAS